MRRINHGSSSSPSSSPCGSNSSSSPSQQTNQRPTTSTSPSRKRTSPLLASRRGLLIPRLLQLRSNGDATATASTLSPPGVAVPATTTPRVSVVVSAMIHRVPVLYLVLLLLVYALSMAAMQTKVFTREMVRSVQMQMHDDTATIVRRRRSTTGVYLPPQHGGGHDGSSNGSLLLPLSHQHHVHLVPMSGTDHRDHSWAKRGSYRGGIKQQNFLGANEGNELEDGAVAVPRAAVDPHYGGLRLRRTRAGYARTIHPDDDNLYHDEKKQQLRAIVKKESYYEDYYDHYDDLDWEVRKDACFRTRTTYEVHPTCNAFHERSLGLADPDHPTTYLGRGYYRMSWTLGDANRNVSKVVLKQLRLKDDQDLDNAAMEQVRVEAMNMERTTWSDRTTDIYGHCSTSIVVEMAYPIEYKLVPSYDYPKDPSTIVGPQSHLTGPQKLKVLLSMAEGLALLHGNPDATIVNDDIQLSQWLLGKDNKIKLNDFNKAIILEWSPVNHTYCDMHSIYTHQYRAPEQLNYHWPVDERADVFAFGHTMYSILTGMIPFYEHGSRDQSLKFNKEGGALPYIDPWFRDPSRFIESRLADIMVPCYQYRREDRTSIFEVVRNLRETVRLYEQQFPNETRIADVPLRDIVEDGFL